MELAFCALASGSSGNSYMIKSPTTLLLVDVGISGKRIVEGLAAAGAQAAEVDGILITHEHADHVQSLSVMQKKSPDATVYTNLGTWQCVAEKVAEERHQLFMTGEPFTIGDIVVSSFAVSHDAAEPVGFSFTKGESKITLVTDTGCVSEEIYEAAKGSDLIVLEANHDEHVLQFCRYPYHIKRRILSDHGHLSNDTAADMMCRLLEEEEKRPAFLLAHLSRENNTPDMARLTFENRLEETAVFENREDNKGDLVLEVLHRDRPSKVYIL